MWFSEKDIPLSKIVFENMKQKEEKNFDTVAFVRDINAQDTTFNGFQKKAEQEYNDYRNATAGMTMPEYKQMDTGANCCLNFDFID
jgi:hypothetical protein